MEIENQRDEELSTLSAIFPEIQRLHDDDPYTFAFDVPVNPTRPVTVFFPAATEGREVITTAAQIPEQTTIIDSHELAHLPAVHLLFSLPPSYPTDKPPAVTISTAPSWLPPATVKRLEGECTHMWEELGRDLVLFAYIDHIQQSADDVFGLVSNTGGLEISPEHKIAVLDYDIEARKQAFDKETYDCGVCLDPKKGAKCHRMLDCGHVFCVQCLQDFYNNAITEGDVATVRCLEPSCAKEREAALKSEGKRRRVKAFISPSELLQIPLEPEMVQRYVRLKYKTELESDKNTIYCPRPWCGGAARSEKHKKPKGFELYEAEEDSDDEDEQPNPNPTTSDKAEDKFNDQAKLAVCEDCNFAFCSGCDQSWHGKFTTCAKRKVDDLEKEEEATLKFLDQHTTPCPSCGSRASKTEGCNHMLCFRCRTHYCYLCGAWLSPSNPYAHFNQPPGTPLTSCHMRLWDFEGGDDAENGFVRGEWAPAGQAAAAQPGRQAEREAEAPPVDPGLQGALLAEGIDEDDALRADALAWEEHLAGAPGNNRADRNNEPPPQRVQALGANGGHVVVAQEGPLVLRLDAGGPRAARAQLQQQQQGEVAAPQAARQQRQGAVGPHRNHAHPGMARQLQHHQQQQFGQRGRGGRGGRGRGFGRRENNNHHPNQGPEPARRQRENNPQAVAQERAAGQQDELQDRDAAWIRHFVHLALEDNEHLIDEDD